MKHIHIEGGHPLQGTVTIQGAKNAAQKILPATIAFPGTYILNNVPRIEDTSALMQILRFLGAKITFLDTHRLCINTEEVNAREIPPTLTALSTGTFLFAGALLSRCGEVKIWHPGGDKIGQRSVSWHLEAFQRLGATVREHEAYYDIRATTLQGTTITFPRPTANGAVNAMIAAARAKGTTLIEQIAPEPEIENFILFLQTIGISLSWQSANSLVVEGKPNTSGTAEVDIIPDRNDAATFLIAGVLGQGPVTLENVREEHLRPLLHVLKAIGVHLEYAPFGANHRIRLHCEQLGATDLALTSRPYPEFSTDWGPLVQVLMTQIPGTHTFHETIFSQRFAHLPMLTRMGAAMHPIPAPIEEAYHFAPHVSPGHHAIRIQGPSQLHGATVHANDVRAGAALVLAGLTATGVTDVSGIDQIERGYEAFAERLGHLGASIQTI